MPQPAEPGAASPVDPVAPIDRTGGYLGATGAAAVVQRPAPGPRYPRIAVRRNDNFGVTVETERTIPAA